MGKMSKFISLLVGLSLLSLPLRAYGRRPNPKPLPSGKGLHDSIFVWYFIAGGRDFLRDFHFGGDFPAIFAPSGYGRGPNPKPLPSGKGLHDSIFVWFFIVGQGFF